jgi:hypothetical protein
MADTAIPIKLRIGISVIRLRIDRNGLTLENLAKEIQQRLTNKTDPLKLRYLDEDGTEIDIISPKDLEEAINIYDQAQMTSLQLISGIFAI